MLSQELADRYKQKITDFYKGSNKNPGGGQRPTPQYPSAEEQAFKREFYDFRAQQQKARGESGMRTQEMRPSKYKGIDARDEADYTAFLKSKGIDPNDQKYANPGFGGGSTARQGQPERFTVPGGEVVNGAFRPSNGNSDGGNTGGGNKSQYGERLGMDPNLGFTMDFKDSDGDGVDDRLQRGPGQPREEVGVDFKGGGNQNFDGGFRRDPNSAPGRNPNTRPMPDFGSIGKGIQGTYPYDGNEGPGFGINPPNRRGRRGRGNRPSYGRRVRGTAQPYNPNASQGGGQGQGQGSSQNFGNGYMNFMDIMDSMYSYQPSADDDEGRAMKNAFGYDMMSKFFDSMLSRGMGQYQAGLSKDMMNHAYTLEQLGLSNSRKEEFGYGMRAMDKQYELQNLFANQQYGRDLGELAAVGEQTRKNYRSQGRENRLQTITEGEQQRLNYAAKGDQDRRGYRVLGDEERQTMEKEYGYDIGREREKGTQERLNIGKRGDESRKSYEFEDKIDARQEQRERTRARAQARAF